MAAKTAKPPGLARPDGLGNVVHAQAIDVSRFSKAHHQNQTHLGALEAVREAIVCGATFEHTERDFIWSALPGANRGRIREIIAEQKNGSPAEWQAFVAAIIEATKEPATP